MKGTRRSTLVRMEFGDVATWVSAGLAAVSAVGATVAWWQSNLSRNARHEAEDARTRAAEALDAAQRQADAAKEQAETARRSAASIEQIAAAFERPPLEAKFQAGSRWLLRNNTDDAVQIVADLSKGPGPSVHWDDALPVVIAAKKSVSFMVIGTAQGTKKELELQLEGRDQPLVVPLDM